MQGLEKQAKFYKISAVVLLAVSLIFFGMLLSKGIFSKSTNKTTVDLSSKAKPLGETTVEKGFDFPISKTGTDKFRIKIEKATLVKMVTNKSKPVLSKTGESFLLVYLEIENNLKTSLNVGSSNYFRLIDNNRKFAPDFYNTSVSVPAISTKKDQIGFVVKEDQKTFSLQVGEIEGKKEIIEIKF